MDAKKSANPPKHKGQATALKSDRELVAKTTENNIKDASVDKRDEAQAMGSMTGTSLARRPRSMMTAVDDTKPEKKLAIGKPHLMPVTRTAK
jgi:hypothetical protein